MGGRHKVHRGLRAGQGGVNHKAGGRGLSAHVGVWGRSQSSGRGGRGCAEGGGAYSSRLLLISFGM